jgi:hypothetical protein
MASRALLAVAAVVVLVAGCSSSGFERWADIESGRVTVKRAGVPPPGGEPETTRFTSGDEIEELTDALNANRIAELDFTKRNEGCTGGLEVEIRIVQANGIITSLHSYLCAGEQYGDVAGNVQAFLEVLDLG